MDFKALFDKAENGVLNYAQFQEAIKDCKLVDLTTGDYVSKKKYDDELANKDSQIATLNDTLSTRNADLETVKKQLEDAGTDVTKLNSVSGELEKLQSQYATDMQAWQDKLNKQAYEFAVKEFANTKKFTSNAAKRDFVNSMIAENLKLKKDNTIMGAEDFVESYSKDNFDAFVEDKQPEPETPPVPSPTFASPTFTPKPEDATNMFASAFNFSGIRPKE